MIRIYINIQTKHWTQIPWTKVEAYVHRLQTRIYQASRDQHYGQMRALQKRLTSGVHAKLLAVRLVTVQQPNGLLKSGNALRNERVSHTSTLPALVRNLKLEGQAPYKATSLQRPHQYTECLPPEPLLNLPDLAKQALAKMALEPEWEARFEPYLYGYRPGSKGRVQALSAIRSALRDQTFFALYADIQFEGLEPEALLNKLNTYPSMRQQIRAWLKADPLCLFVCKRRDPSQVRTVSLAPLLANIAVHGMAQVLLVGLRHAVSTPALKAQLHHSNAGDLVVSSSGLRLYGNADEFVVLHEKASVVFKAKQLLATWLNTMGLTLHPDSTRITTTVAGLHYDGHKIATRKSGRQASSTQITPSKLSQARLLATIRGILRSKKGAAAHVLIGQLLPLLVGWGNYFKYSDCFRVFKRMDHTILQQQRAWVLRRHAHWGRHQIKLKYFPANHTWVLNGQRYRDNWLLHAAYYNGKRLRRVHLVRLRWLKRHPGPPGKQAFVV
jgi:RNA-directed DNA polymerase